MSDNEDKKDIQILSEKVHIGIDVSGMQWKLRYHDLFI